MIDLKTRRLHIRRFEEQDIEGFMEYRNNETWMKFQGFKGLSKEEYKTALLKNPELEAGCQLALILGAKNIIVGDLYLKKTEEHIEIGYTIHPDHAGLGLAAEAVERMKQYFDEEYSVPDPKTWTKNIRGLRGI